MMERGWIELIVERVVGEVLESHATQVRTEIVCRVMDEIAAEQGWTKQRRTNLDCPHSRRLNRSKTMRVRRIWHVPSPKSNWALRNARS